MKLLVVGSGGREHAVIFKLKESQHKTDIYAAPGNGGIASLATCLNIGADDIDGVVDFSLANNIDLVVVTPDNPLVEGMVDALEKNGIKAFGPKRAGALLEGSKSFAKAFMRKYQIPTADYEEFTDYEAARLYLEKQDKFPLVIKADGLALGKGVIISLNKEEALQAAKDILQNNQFGKSGDKIIVEEFLTGPEVSVMAFTDGKTIKILSTSMDYKRSHDNNEGLNTGGMGAIAPHPLFNSELSRKCYKHIFLPTINGLKSEGIQYKGILYFGIILTASGPYVLEYNCRFGDPETQVVLPLLDGDLLEIILAVCDERLASVTFKQKEASAACVIMASKGYPSQYQTGYIISGVPLLQNKTDLMICQAGTKIEGSDLKTSGGRVLGVSALGSNLEEAVARAYQGVAQINFDNAYFRNDIGKHWRP